MVYTQVGIHAVIIVYMSYSIPGGQLTKEYIRLPAQLSVAGFIKHAVKPPLLSVGI